MNKKQSIRKKAIAGIIGIALLAGLLSLSFAYAVPASDGWSEEVDVLFGTGGVWTCNTTSMVWQKPGAASQDAWKDCLRVGVSTDGSLQTACCPQGYSCSFGIISANTQGYVCTQSGTPLATSCGDFKTKDECILISASYPKLPQSILDTIEGVSWNKITEDIIAQVDPDFDEAEASFCDNTFMHNKGNKCAYLGNCKCIWDEGTKECRGSYQLTFKCLGGDDDRNIQNDIITCEQRQNPILDTCDQEGGQLRYSWTVVRKNATGGILSGEGDGCHGGERTYPCPPKNLTNQSTLPFFGMFNLIIAGIMIAMGYFIMRRRK
jgi:hypothetical protein